MKTIFKWFIYLVILTVAFDFFKAAGMGFFTSFIVICVVDSFFKPKTTTPSKTAVVGFGPVR